MKNRIVAIFATTITPCMLALTGCGTLDNNNYVRSGYFKDRFDHGAYQYIEAGRSQPIPKCDNLTLNIFGGFHTERSGRLDGMNSAIKDYWEANVEWRF